MEYESISYVLVMVYTALTEATALATGKPVDGLASHLIRELLDENAPPDALDLLRCLSSDHSDPDSEFGWIHRLRTTA